MQVLFDLVRSQRLLCEQHPCSVPVAMLLFVWQLFVMSLGIIRVKGFVGVRSHL